MAYDRPLKAILSEFFKKHFEVSRVDTEYGVLFKEVRIDVLISNPKPKEDFPEGSWPWFIATNFRRYILIELKHIRSKANIKALIRLLLYRLIIAEKFNCDYNDIIPILIVSSIPRDFKSKVEEELNVSVVGSRGLYKLVGSKILESLIIAIDELDPGVAYNEVLLLFSTDDYTGRIAAINVLKRYPSDSFLYSFAVLFRPGVLHMAKGELLSPERLARAIEIIGIDKFAEAINLLGVDKLVEALGPEMAVKMIESLGVDKLVEALGPEKTIEMIIKLLKTIPENERKKILEKIK